MAILTARLKTDLNRFHNMNLGCLSNFNNNYLLKPLASLRPCRYIICSYGCSWNTKTFSLQVVIESLYIKHNCKSNKRFLVKLIRV